MCRFAGWLDACVGEARSGLEGSAICPLSSLFCPMSASLRFMRRGRIRLGVRLSSRGLRCGIALVGCPVRKSQLRSRRMFALTIFALVSLTAAVSVKSLKLPITDIAPEETFISSEYARLVAKGYIAEDELSYPGDFGRARCVVWNVRDRRFLPLVRLVLMFHVKQRCGNRWSSVPHSGVTVWWSARLIWVRSPCDPSRKLLFF